MQTDIISTQVETGLADTMLPLAQAETDSYQLHQHLENVFGPRAETGYLWTLDRIGKRPLVAVRTRTDAPSPEGLLFDRRPVAMPAKGEAAGFRLRASPTYHDDEGRKRPFAVGDTAARVAWLRRQGRMHGFTVESVRLWARAVPVHKPDARPFKIEDCLFTGRVSVNDADRFITALGAGLGPCKSWGFGLLQIL